MKKTDKKTENAIIKVLTRACKIAQVECSGFQWLTHQVNYQRFPDSLLFTCVFDTDQALNQAITEHREQFLHTLIEHHLNTISIPLRDIHRQIRLDTEERCDREHNGNWQKRLQSA